MILQLMISAILAKCGLSKYIYIFSFCDQPTINARSIYFDPSCDRCWAAHPRNIRRHIWSTWSSRYSGRDRKKRSMLAMRQKGECCLMSLNTSIHGLQKTERAVFNWWQQTILNCSIFGLKNGVISLSLRSYLFLIHQPKSPTCAFGRPLPRSLILAITTIPDISNKSVDIKSENCLDIQFISQLRGVNPNLWNCPFYCLKAAFLGVMIWHENRRCDELHISIW